MHAPQNNYLDLLNVYGRGDALSGSGLSALDLASSGGWCGGGRRSIPFCIDDEMPSTVVIQVCNEQSEARRR